MQKFTTKTVDVTTYSRSKDYFVKYRIAVHLTWNICVFLENFNARHG